MKTKCFGEKGFYLVPSSFCVYVLLPILHLERWLNGESCSF